MIQQSVLFCSTGLSLVERMVWLRRSVICERTLLVCFGSFGDSKKVNKGCYILVRRLNQDQKDLQWATIFTLCAWFDAIVWCNWTIRYSMSYCCALRKQTPSVEESLCFVSVEKNLAGFKPMTVGLWNMCSTAELQPLAFMAEYFISEGLLWVPIHRSWARLILIQEKSHRIKSFFFPLIRIIPSVNVAILYLHAEMK